MIQYFGWAAATLFTIASGLQVIKVWREGQAKGMSWWYLLLVWTGFWLMGAYTIHTKVGSALIYSYGLQLVAFTVMIVRKLFPTAGVGV